jgi:hypothetical protein
MKETEKLNSSKRHFSASATYFLITDIYFSEIAICFFETDKIYQPHCILKIKKKSGIFIDWKQFRNFMDFLLRNYRLQIQFPSTNENNTPASYSFFPQKLNL